MKFSLSLSPSEILLGRMVEEEEARMTSASSPPPVRRESISAHTDLFTSRLSGTHSWM